MRAYELTEAPTYFYHGTSDETAAKAILNIGTLIPGDHSGEVHNMTPMVNRTYITSDLGYALIYALGGNYVGSKTSINANDDEYGYIFKIHKGNIKNRIPDEDVVGEKARDIVSGDDSHNFQDAETDELNDLVSYAFNNVIEPDEDEDFSSPYDRFIDHEYEFFAVVGKIILSRGSKRLIASFRRISSHHSGEGAMIIDHAWKFQKKEAANMQRDGSDFFQHATQIK